ncbi:MAG: hypothetical protein R2788_17015 [Saprospiraceae bacterium]
MSDNIFVKYLLKNGWKQLNLMSYENRAKNDYELFFDTSNQVELYFKGKIVNKRYIAEIGDLKLFLAENIDY